MKITSCTAKILHKYTVLKKGLALVGYSAICKKLFFILTRLHLEHRYNEVTPHLDLSKKGLKGYKITQGAVIIKTK